MNVVERAAERPLTYVTAVEHRAGRIEADEDGEEQQQWADEDQCWQGQCVVQAQLGQTVHTPR